MIEAAPQVNQLIDEFAARWARADFPVIPAA